MTHAVRGEVVDFLIIGAAKCATTWLQMSLSQSPGVWMPDPELHYFSTGYDRGPHWYAEQFAGAGQGQVRGEKSNSYLTEPPAAARIARDCPQARLIVQMRDPVARAYSDYCMLLRRGSVSRDIWHHLDPDKAAEGRFLQNGRYAFHIRRFLEYFPPEQILLLDYDAVREAPSKQLRRVAQHIGIATPPDPPLHARVKDRDAPVVPLPLRRILAPVRPWIDPLRQSWPVRTLRDSVARRVNYPDLPPALAAKIAQFYAGDLQDLGRLAPGIGAGWTFMGVQPKDESVAGAGLRGC